jgi:MscS family membrane protein
MTMRRLIQFLLLIGVVSGPIAWAQVNLPGATPVPPQLAPPSDPLGRDTPRGAVLGFLNACRKGDFETARRYLNAPLAGARLDGLARQLSVVLDRRLPARLNKLSPQPEGSLYYPDQPDLDLVGTIDTPDGTVDITMQRVKMGERGSVWLFSKETLREIPELFEEVSLLSVEDKLPAFLTEQKIAEVPLFEWLFALVGLPLVYVLTSLLDRLLGPSAGRLWSRLGRKPDSKSIHIIPKPVRLLVLALVIRWMVANLDLSLLTRQFWSGVASVITIAACVWLVLLLNAWGEDLSRRRLERRGVYGAVSVLRLTRRTVDLLALFGGVLFFLSHFNLNVTAALAGLGVGGIAIALAAQKTLENVIGGISIIADRAMRVGDFVKVGAAMGTIEDIGLRSTRIRTLDRSVVSIPNGQISNERLEDLSSRDKFWLHPILSLRYETTAAQMRSVLAAIRSLLLDHTHVEQNSVRIRFLSFGSSSLDVEVFAYIYALDFGAFLEIQEDLLLRIMDAVQAAGTRMAFPSQTTYLVSDSRFEETSLPEMLKIPVRS